jgi:hypothetical protein
MVTLTYAAVHQTATSATGTTVVGDHLPGCCNPNCSWCFTVVTEATPEPFFEPLPTYQPPPWIAMKQPPRSARRRW